MHSPEERELYRQCRSAVATLASLPDKPEETAEATLAALWHAAAGAPLSAALAAETPLPALDVAGRERLRQLLDRRLAGTPLAHVTGRTRFMGVEMRAGAAALIPRRETELLGRAALARLRALCDAGREALAVDACTGSGNLAVALAFHEPRARFLAIDLSAEAAALARRNAEAHGLAARVEVACGDLLEPVASWPPAREGVDLVTCNPPYISTGKLAALPPEIAEHEPRLAFDGGPLGVGILERLAREAPRFVRAGGCLAFEVGAGQGRGLRRRLERDEAWEAVDEVPDEAGVVRALVALRRA